MVERRIAVWLGIQRTNWSKRRSNISSRNGQSTHKLPAMYDPIRTCSSFRLEDLLQRCLPGVHVENKTISNEDIKKSRLDLVLVEM